MNNNSQIPFHDLPAEQLIAKLEIVKHKDTLNEDEAALYLNITLNAIRALRKKRRITYQKYGDRIQYEMIELRKYKNSNRVQSFSSLSPAMA